MEKQLKKRVKKASTSSDISNNTYLNNKNASFKILLQGEAKVLVFVK